MSTSLLIGLRGARSARPAPAAAGAGLRRGEASAVGGGRGADPGRPRPTPEQSPIPAEPRRGRPQPQPDRSRHRRSRIGGPRAPAAPEPRPVSPAGAALRGSLGRGVQSRSALARTPPTRCKFGARRLPRQGSQERGPRGKGGAGLWGVCCEGTQKSSCPFLLEMPGVWAPRALSSRDPQIVPPAPFWTTRRLASGNRGLGKTLRVEGENEGPWRAAPPLPVPYALISPPAGGNG